MGLESGKGGCPVLPEAGTAWQKVMHHRTAVDSKLLERTGLDEFTLRRVRKAFMLAHRRLTFKSKRLLVEGGTSPRFAFMHATLTTCFSGAAWTKWLSYLEHSSGELEEMCRGEYPISPYLVRVYSALFGIKVDFLLVGSTPQADRVGASIDVIPLSAG